MTTPPRFPVLADFLAAHARGEVSREAHVVCWTGSCRVEIVAPVGELTEDHDEPRASEVLFRARSSDEFAMAFAEALGLEGRMS